MTQTYTPEGWSERMESKLDQVLDRLTRMEERQSSLAGKVEAHEARLSELADRVRAQENITTELGVTAKHQHQQLSGRWKAIGTVAIAAASVAGGFLSRIFFP